VAFKKIVVGGKDGPGQGIEEIKSLPLNKAKKK
jgi:hypothetical protein